MKMQQVHRLFLALVIAFSITYIHHSQQTLQSESEAQLRLDNNALIHFESPNARKSQRFPEDALNRDLPHQTQTPTKDQVSYLAALKNNKVMLVLRWKKKTMFLVCGVEVKLCF